DILLNVAGISDTMGSVDTLEESAWNKIIAVDLTAPAMLSKHVVNVFRKQGGGNIVNVSSKGGISGAVTGVAYTAAKHGIVSGLIFPAGCQTFDQAQWLSDEMNLFKGGYD